MAKKKKKKMEVGMLWQFGSDKDMEANVRKAAIYYDEKYSIVPNLCVINPEQIEKLKNVIWDKGVINCIGDIIITRGHLWIGKFGEG